MMPALAFPEQNQVEWAGLMPARDEVLARYRRLRAISKAHHNRALVFLSPGAVMQHLRRLGLAERNRIILGCEGEGTLASDLAVYIAAPGRSRARDRYARNAPPPAGSDDALVLDAMRGARFAVLGMQCR